MRTWRVPVAFEKRLRRSKPSQSPQSINGQRFGSPRTLRPLCPEPECAGTKAWGRYAEAKIQADYREQRQLNATARQARREWEAHCAQLRAAGAWDADGAWDAAFPHLAFGGDASTQPAPLEAGHAAR